MAASAWGKHWSLRTACPNVVSHVIVDSSAKCRGGADIEVNVCATPAHWEILGGTGH
jgi:hypothetical protein